MHPQEAGWISSAHLVFLLTTSSWKYGPFVVTDQGQGTLTGKRWPTVYLSLPFLLCHPRLSSRKVQCGRESWAGSWLFVNRGSDQPTTGWNRASALHSHKSWLVIQEMRLNSSIGGSFVNAVWKVLSILTTCQLCHLEKRCRKRKQHYSSSDNSILTLIPQCCFCCWHRFLPRWVLNKVLVDFVFLPYLGHKTRIQSVKETKRLSHVLFWALSVTGGSPLHEDSQCTVSRPYRLRKALLTNS